MADGGGPAIGLDELERALKAADPRAFLVPPRILRRVIKHDQQLRTVGLAVPHRKTYVIDSARAAEIVQWHELGHAAGEVPQTLILIARPDEETLAAMPRGEALIKHWRLLFHGRIHLEFEQRAEVLTSAAVRDRIDRIGQAEFDEIRAVLRQERFLFPGDDDSAIYIEFAAVFLELRYFARWLVPHVFPTIDNPDAVERILAEDVEISAVLTATCPPGAPVPMVRKGEPGASDETEGHPWRDEPSPGHRSESLYERLTRQADILSKRGNQVRAAMFRSSAARLAPPRLVGRARASAKAELDRLAHRLVEALEVDDDEYGRWRRILPTLVTRSKSGFRTPEGRLLYDLQKVCVDHERDVYTVDLVEWALTLGERPIRRLLPNQREVLMSKHLRRASSRLASARLGEGDRARLSSLLREAVERAERGLRERFRPLLVEAFEGTGLVPRNLPERVALDKLVEELLDRIVERGFLAMGDIRDAISRNNLKLPDLSNPAEFYRGDRLLAVDGRLAITLDGVYRRGEIYLRMLQRMSSLAFGTRVGRFLTRYLALPFGGAFVLLEGAQHLVGPLVHWLSGAHVHLLTATSFVATGMVVLGLLHVGWFRAMVVKALMLLYRSARGLLLDLPAWLVRLPWLRRMMDSRMFSLVWRGMILPMILTAALWVAVPDPLTGRATAVPAAGVLCATLSLLLNSRAWRDAEEILVDAIIRLWHRLRLDLIPGLYRLVMETFDRLLEALDRLLYSVDEWLRFRGGEGRLTLVAKGVLGVFWFFITYLVRIYVNLLIEPQVNPIKHFPVVTVSHKLTLPLAPHLTRIMAAPLMPVLGKVVAYAIAGTTVLLLPGVFGFLVWELKENWRLYEANRPATLLPVVIGSHGETMIRLMRPGLHSGTLPKLFARLRQAERKASRPVKARAARKYRKALHHVEEAIRRFVDRELVALLRLSKGLGGAEIGVGEVALATNRIRVELLGPGRPLWLGFEEQAGWVVAGIAEPGWLAGLSAVERQTLAVALAGLYKMAGVDLVREQIGAILGPGELVYDIAEEGLVVWPAGDGEAEAIYDLRNGPAMTPRPSTGRTPASLPTLDAGRLLFARAPVSWARWLDAWARDQAGIRQPEDLTGAVVLLPS